MGVYKAAVVTEEGQNLIAQALADNKALMFTSAKTSSYAYPSGTNITALTGLQDVVQSVIPSKSQVLNNNVAQVTARFDNDGITQQYPIHTIGLYAQVDEGTETLFSVTQAITPDEMPVQSDVSPSAFIYNIQHTVQNAAQITITVNPAGTATVEDILEIENPEFDDSGSVTGIASFPDLLSKVVSKMNIFQFYRDLKAGLQFVLHAGQLVNNCTSTATDLPLAAAQGKVLMDLYTKLNSDFQFIGDIKYARFGSYFSTDQMHLQYGIDSNNYLHLRTNVAHDLILEKTTNGETTKLTEYAQKKYFEIKQSKLTLNEGIEVYYNNTIIKSGNIVYFKLQLRTFTIKNAQQIATIPIGFRPLGYAIGVANADGRAIIYNISEEGKLVLSTGSYGSEITSSVDLSGSYIST